MSLTKKQRKDIQILFIGNHHAEGGYYADGRLWYGISMCKTFFGEKM